MQFTAKLVSDRSATPSRSTIKEGEYFVHCFVRHDSLVGVCLTDEEFVFFFWIFFWGKQIIGIYGINPAGSHPVQSVLKKILFRIPGMSFCHTLL